QEALLKCCDKWAEDYKGNIFKISTYIKLISMSQDKVFSGDLLLTTLNKSKLNLSQLYKELKKDLIYPLPLIFWDLAKYYSKKNNSKLVKENIEKAIHPLSEISDSAHILKVLATAITGWNYLYYADGKKFYIEKEKEFQQTVSVLI